MELTYTFCLAMGTDYSLQYNAVLNLTQHFVNQLPLYNLQVLTLIGTVSIISAWEVRPSM